jgi:hypothetical protein
MSRGSSRGSSRCSSSTTSATPRVQVPRLVMRLVAPLVVDYFDYAARLGAPARRAARLVACRRQLRLCRASGCLGTSRGSSCRVLSSTSTTPRVRVPRHVTRLVTRLVAPLVVDYFASAARPGASARRAASRGSSRRSSSTTPPRAGSSSTTPPRVGSSLTTSPPLCVRLLRHVARLVTRLVLPRVLVNFDYAARPGSSASHAARHAARHRLLRLHRASGCLNPSRGSSSTTSHTLHVQVPRHVARLITRLVLSSTTSPTPRVRVPRHVMRLVTRLVVDYSVRCDFVMRPH